MSNIYHYRLKTYPNGTSEYVEFKNGNTSIDSGNYKNQKPKNKKHQLKLADSQFMPTKIEDLSELQKLARRKVKVKDYVLSGNFQLFGTLTFAPEHASDNLDDVLRHKMILFTRMLRRRGTRYYIVAEKHKSGKIHLHGLFSDNLTTAKSPNSRRYLHIPLWTYGYSSVGQIRDYVGTAYYVTKYVTKECLDGKSVWVSQGLITPTVQYNVPDLLTPVISEWYSDNVNITLRGK